MPFLSLQAQNGASVFEAFLEHISDKLAAAICKKLQAYTELDEVYSCSSLKILRPKIWGYKGTIYKLRVDCGKESARVLFVKGAEDDIILLHGFLKKTRKTPAKEAKIAIENLKRLRNNEPVCPLPFPKKLKNVRPPR